MTTMPEFLEALSDDLRLAASAQTPILAKLVSQLREHPGFISGPALRERISTLWPDEANLELVDALWRLILGLHEVVNENGFDNEQRNHLFDAVSETAGKNGDEDAARLKEILRSLAGP